MTVQTLVNLNSAFRCQFHQHFTYKSFVRMLFWQLFLCTCNYRKAAETTFIQKMLVYNIDKIDGRTDKCKEYTLTTMWYLRSVIEVVRIVPKYIGANVERYFPVQKLRLWWGLELTILTISRTREESVKSVLKDASMKILRN